MNQTHHCLPEGDREQLVGLLNARLADLIDLQTQVKQAHWNVKGPSFIALHELFARVGSTIDQLCNQVAERATSLGGTAYGTARVVAERSGLTEYPLDTADGLAHCRAIAEALGRANNHIRTAIEESSKLRDAGTQALFTQISRILDTQLGFVDAHLHA